VDYRDTLEEIESKGGLVGGGDAALRFMIEVCEKMALPEQARASFEVAVQYARKGVSDDALEAARVRCWRSIDGHDSELSDKGVAATRAVICTLYPRARQDDLFGALDAFEGFALAAGVTSEELREGLRRAFGTLPNPPSQTAGRAGNTDV
jgi:hypothetical protein